MTRTPDLPALYPIVDVRDEGAATGRAALDLARVMAQGGATIVQLRAKPLSSGAFETLALRMQDTLTSLNSRLIVNDRTDIALSSSAFGVHLGQDDLPLADARRIAGKNMAIGISTHSEAEASKVDPVLADYLAFGPIFESPTKSGVRRPRGLGELEAVCRHSELPVVAIGGITLTTAPQVWSAGATSVAVISEFERTDDVEGLVARYLDAGLS